MANNDPPKSFLLPELDKRTCEQFQYYLNESGYISLRIDGREVKLYSAELSTFLVSKNLPTIDPEQEKQDDDIAGKALENLSLIHAGKEPIHAIPESEPNCFINGSDYLDDFLKGYAEGTDYFKNSYALPIGVLYGENAETYVMKIHDAYCRNGVGKKKGWKWAKGRYPLLITHEAIRELGYYSALVSATEELLAENRHLFSKFGRCNQTPPQVGKPKPKLNTPLIIFRDTEAIEKLHSVLRGHFPGKEDELRKALKGEQLKEPLLFPNNQNKLVEVFKRAKYNGFIASPPKKIKEWICSTFVYQYQKGDVKEVRNFNPLTVHDILTKDKGEPTKSERICKADWLPYKSHRTRQIEAEKESN